jgi:gamma-glutamylcyclotransferase (GGCT)/AIG2-like uncharacterized protein YtfP
MTGILLSDVTQLIAAANAARERHDVTEHAVSSSVSDAERELDSLFAVSRTLAVYGTLAPGRPNHHVVAPLGGEWTAGIVEGDLLAEGWGAPLGYPAFNPRVGGADVPVHVLTSPALPSAFSELDAFEGHEYRRILIPVFTADPPAVRRLYAVANIYAAAARPSETEQRSETKR